MNCNFEIEDDKKANLNCKLNIEKYKDQPLFTFKTFEINTNENDFYLARIDEISLLNAQEEEEKKNYTGIIIGCVVGGAVLIGGITTLIICLKKAKMKTKFNSNNNNNNNVKKIEGNDKVIKFENNPSSARSKEIINNI